MQKALKASDGAGALLILNDITAQGPAALRRALASRGRDGTTPFFAACRGGVSELALRILDIAQSDKDTDVWTGDPDDRTTPFYWAVRKGMEKVARQMIAFRRREKLTFKDLCTEPLAKGEARKLAAARRSEGRKPAPKGSALWWACFWGFEEVAMAIITECYQLPHFRLHTEVGGDGTTPFYWAIVNRMDRVAFDLLSFTRPLRGKLLAPTKDDLALWKSLRVSTAEITGNSTFFCFALACGAGMPSIASGLATRGPLRLKLVLAALALACLSHESLWLAGTIVGAIVSIIAGTNAGRGPIDLSTLLTGGGISMMYYMFRRVFFSRLVVIVITITLSMPTIMEDEWTSSFITLYFFFCFLLWEIFLMYGPSVERDDVVDFRLPYAAVQWIFDHTVWLRGLMHTYLGIDVHINNPRVGQQQQQQQQRHAQCANPNRL
tara:strand:- start:1382 stop:2692 length:1311 start_codon:yes stop_codon:yes gene_type:complete